MDFSLVCILSTIALVLIISIIADWRRENIEDAAEEERQFRNGNFYS